MIRRLTILVLLAIAATVDALAADVYSAEVSGTTFYFTVSGDTATITNEYGGYYSSTDDAPQSYSDTITIPATITYKGTEYTVGAIGSYAFYGDTLLTSVTFTDNCVITSLGRYAFYGCTKLTSIGIIPSGVNTIGEYVFRGCTGLTSMDLSSCAKLDSISTGCFYDCTALTSVTLPTSLTKISDNAFYDCTALTSIGIPSSVTSIGQYAFFSCTRLTSIDLSGCAGLTSLSDYTFFSCMRLTSISIPSGVTSFGKYVFRSCKSLTSMDLSKYSLTSLGTGCFYGCTKLASVTLPSTLTEISDNAFYGDTLLTSIDIPSGVTSIGQYAFFNCKSLTSIDLSDCTGLTSLGVFTFYNCTGLTSIGIPSGVTSLGQYVLRGCTSLTSMDLSTYTELTSLGTGCFYGCTALASVTLPSTLTEISDNAFLGCEKLASIDIPSGVTSIGQYAFSECMALKKVKFYSDEPPTLTNLWPFFSCDALDSLFVKPYAMSNYITAKNDTTTYHYYIMKSDTISKAMNFYAFADFSISSVGAATLALPFESRVAASDNISLYTLTYTDGAANADATELTDLTTGGTDLALPQGTPVYVSGNAGSYCFYGTVEGSTDNCILAQTATPQVGNLVGVFSSETTYAPKGSYVLQNQEEGGLKFYKVKEDNSVKVGQYRAYLTVDDDSNSEAKYIGIDFSGTTAISAVSSTTESATDAPVYTLQGVRVSGDTQSLPRGIYIRGGKKFVVK